MNKKWKLSVLFGCMLALCLLAGACTTKSKDDEMAEQGYVVSVTYDAGSGRFFSRDGVTIKDYINPSTFDKDGDGVAEIKLVDPEDPVRKASVGKTGHFLAGWYTQRELVLQDGKVVDDSGRELEELDDGTWIVKGTKDTASYPVYRYSDPWDFNETFTYDPSQLEETGGRFSMTLYAGWIPYYEFHYYSVKDGVASAEPYAKTSFDYGRNIKTGGDQNTIWLPDWLDGAMNYKHDYAGGSAQYVFPKIDGTTFLKAYSDAVCQTEIVDTLVHQGTLDVDNCAAVNRIQNVYVTVEEGERYKISTAEQLSKNGNQNGYYEIYGDLDFTNLSWPGAFSLNEFNGRFYPANGVSSVTISNVSATIVTSGAYGGLFGKIGEKAVLQNVQFSGVTVDFSSVSGFGGMFGLLSGEIDEEANVSNVSVGGTLKIGDFNNYGFTMNAVANGDLTGVSHTPITVIFYGQDNFGTSRYSYNPTTADVVASTGDVMLTLGAVWEEGLALEFIKTYN